MSIVDGVVIFWMLNRPDRLMSWRIKYPDGDHLFIIHPFAHAERYFPVAFYESLAKNLAVAISFCCVELFWVHFFNP
jgi:hypothetical protein